MRPDYRIQNLFGIELPIVQAPMAGVAFSEMVVGVCEAGGLGSLACGLLTPPANRPRGRNHPAPNIAADQPQLLMPPATHG
jgi:NAD(P)H-dependent flavin oxidoreductase YrpB (nitropropane dioxygenase family)